MLTIQMLSGRVSVFPELGLITEFNTLSIIVSVHKIRSMCPKHIPMIGRFNKTSRYLILTRF